jgi:hypothetical protein
MACPPDVSPGTDPLAGGSQPMAEDRAANEPGVVTKLSPRPVAARHGLTPDLEKNLAAVDVLTDALVAPA